MVNEIEIDEILIDDDVEIGNIELDVIKLAPEQPGEGGTSDYRKLANKPQINGIELVGNKTTKDLGIEAGKEVHIGEEEPTNEEVIWIDPTEEADKIPTKTSELENDSGFITEIPDIPTKTSELENDSGFITEIPDIPTKTSELENDSGFITEIPDIPTKVSELENDSEFITMPRISKNTATTTGINLTNNTVHRFTNTMTNLTLALPSTIDELFQCEVIFKSGTTATSLTYDENIKWSGDDLKDDVFVPFSEKTYNILFWYDGFNINAVVRGV